MTDLAAARRALGDRPPPAQQVQPITKPTAAEPYTQAEGYAEVDVRSRGRCEHPSGCDERAEVHHHIAGRRGPDPHHPDNLLHLCDPHHLWTHAHPAESYALGTMRKRLS